MPRTKEQFAEMRDASNQKIRSAALKLFVDKGFSSTSIDEIAQVANLSKGMVYRHYKSKEELFLSLIHGATEGLRRMTQDMERANDPKAALEAVMAEIHADITSGDDYMNLMMLVTQGIMGGSPVCGAVIDTDTPTIEAAADLIRRGQEIGVFGKGDPSEMSIFAFSFIQGLALLKRALGERFKMPGTGILTAFLYRGVES